MFEDFFTAIMTATDPENRPLHSVFQLLPSKKVGFENTKAMYLFPLIRCICSDLLQIYIWKLGMVWIYIAL